MIFNEMVPCKITKQGISKYPFFIEWEKISSYEWTGSKVQLLTVKFKKGFFFKSINHNVSLSDKTLVEELLQTHIHNDSPLTP